MIKITAAPHDSLYARAVVCEFAQELSALPDCPRLRQLLTPAPSDPLPLTPPDDTLKQSIRKMLRFGGFKPSGRSKPASEYLVRAAGEGQLSSINPAVDALNAVSLHSGIPISVVDLDRVQGDSYRLGIAPEGESYVFNASGQVMDLKGLICMFDEAGPCANPVKDSQRTKTHNGSRRTLTIFWGSQDARAATDKAAEVYSQLLQDIGGITSDIPVE